MKKRNLKIADSPPNLETKLKERAAEKSHE